MARPLPKNLQRLYQLIGPDAAAQMYDGYSFVVDGVEFVSGYAPDSTAERFYIVKSEELLAMYREFFAEHRPARIFELGIAEGGSVALLALMPQLTRLVAIDNEVNRLEALDEFVAARHLGDVVSTYYGVDQADGKALVEIVDRDFGGGEIDLVIDDASHQYALTRASFEILFPRVRAGGWYLIEDWSQALKFATKVAEALEEQGIDEIPTPAGGEPLTRLGLELAIATCAASGVIDRVVMNHEFIAVRRGPQPIDPDAFRLGDLTRGEAVAGLLAPSREG